MPRNARGRQRLMFCFNGRVNSLYHYMLMVMPAEKANFSG